MTWDQAFEELDKIANCGSWLGSIFELDQSTIQTAKKALEIHQIGNTPPPASIKNNFGTVVSNWILDGSTSGKFGKLTNVILRINLNKVQMEYLYTFEPVNR